MNKTEFIKQYAEKIQELVNQDSVRNETVKREIEDGTAATSVDNSTTIAAYQYQQALSAGFSDDQAFFMACKNAGIEIEAPYMNKT
ncbi:hypothetical protein CNR29_07410 [Levilactobacillus brevis]|uniref:Uncharacterized protein n=1 Tax=Levilactobacillus brevis TaxID=1580 RepID=A0A2A3TXV1_LEVBR|nr:hypothetical protein [Levilactobacillus brevis]PBQ23852.1 hypothetical protein CNR29_07410 [Levilactobacillus brevis]